MFDRIILATLCTAIAAAATYPPLPVKFLPQVPPGEWSTSANCGPTSVLMVASYYAGANPMEQEIEQIDQWMGVQFGYRLTGENSSEPSGNDMATLAKEYNWDALFGIAGLQLPDAQRYANWHMWQLQQELANGYPVIVGVYTSMNPNLGYKHFMVLVGMDDNFVYVNDPGKIDPATSGVKDPSATACPAAASQHHRCYTITDFTNAWQKNANNAVVVIHPNGTPPPPQTWSHTWGGSAADSLAAVTHDSVGNIYAVGATSSFGAGGNDVLLMKYSPSGALVWSKTWGGASDDFATSVAVGPDGFIYVTGGTSSFGAGWYDMILLKLDTNGTVLSGTTWGGGSYDVGHDIGFDANGNIYVVAESYSYGPCCSTAALLRFSPDLGAPRTTLYKGPATYDGGYALTVDSGGNVIIAGTSWNYGVIPLHNSLLLVKYDPNGNLLWQENFNSRGLGDDQSAGFHALVTDSLGNVYVGGNHTGLCQTNDFSPCDFDGLLLKVNAAGTFQWANTWGTVGTYDTAQSIAIDQNGNVLVSEILNSTGTTPTLSLLTYDRSNGNLLVQTSWSESVPSVSMVSDATGTYIAGAAANNTGEWTTVNNPQSSLSNQLVMNAYSVGTATGAMSALTVQTVDQTSYGTQDTGGGTTDALVMKH